MKAIIKLDVPECQIGQQATVYFQDGTTKIVICEAVKEREKPEKLLPCVCGSKRREHWFGSGDRSIILKCCRCGLEAAGKNEIEAHKEWNEMIAKKNKEI